MTIYVISILFASLIILFGERYFYKSVALRALTAGIAILTLCFVAGARDIGVGIDMIGYGQFTHSKALLSSNYFHFSNDVGSSYWKVDPLFALLAFLVTRVTTDVFWYYFFIELLILLPAYIAIARFSDGESSQGFCCYCLMFYPLGLNLMRQTIAMSFMILAFSYIVDKRKICAILCMAVAAGFHRTALIGFLLLAAYILIFSDRRHGQNVRKYAPMVICLIAIVGFIFFISPTAMLQLMSNYFNGVFDRYLVGNYDESGFLSFSLIHGMALFLLITPLFMNIHMKRNTLVMFVAGVVVSALLFRTLGQISAPIGRLAYYPLVLMPILMVLIDSEVKTKGYIKITSIYGSLLIELVGFFYFFMINNSNNVYPYISSILGI